ncbi:MAG: FAD-dependent oxidoreductase [Candidatus Brocadiia bacterium]
MVAAGGPHAAPALGGQGRMVWLEADRFDDLGGWTRDAQFIDQMGSPYLLAVGLGTPVADAVTTLKVPQPGRYRLWARARDWAPEHSPGRFRIVLDGRPAEHVFGAAGKPGWRWEDGGVHELAGETELRLRDLTGFYARCDAILLTDDLGWTPPQDLQAIAELRRRLGGLSPTVEDAGPYDVVVVGGGLAGCMSAVSAARMGARTALIQNRPMLGGNASTEIVVPPVGVWPHGKHRPGPLDPRETGLIEEVRTAGDQRTREALHYPPRLLRLVQAEPGLDLYLNTHATGVEMTDEDTIGAVLALGVRDGQRRRFRSRLFVDCTGDGVIGVAAGADYRHGREPRSMYGEPHAPEVGDHKTMGNSIKYVSKPTAKPQPFEAPPWAMTFPHCSDFTPRRHPRLGGDIGWQWMLELGGNRDTYADAEAIRDDLLRLVFGIWDHVKNRCPKLKEKAADHQLVWVGHVAGKRESRRLLGDYVLTEHDIADQALQPDRVAYGGWSLDDHHPDGFFHRGRPVRIPGGGQYHGQTFSIPYRCLYSRNIENLLMAGRDISASHVALSDTRVMLTCAVMGQAAGTAAGLCVQRGTTPRGVYQRYLTDLQQQLLKDGAHIIGLPNRDPRDLARQAALSASSERLQEEGRLSAENVIDGYARAANGETHAWQPEEGDKTSWLQLAWAEPQAFNVVHVTFLTPRHLPDRFAVLVEQGGGWEAVAEVGSTDQRRHTLALERARASKLRVAFAGGGVAVNEVRVYDGPPRVVEVARRSERLKLAPDPAVMVPWSLGLDPRALPGIVVDGSQAAAEGRWSHSTWTRPYVGDGYLHDGNEAKAQKSLTFRPRISKAGRYEVRLAYTAYDNRATNTPVTIATADGSKTLRINQQEEPPIDRLWLSLGIFRLGPDPAIVVSNGGTDGYVVVDAVQLIPR